MTRVILQILGCLYVGCDSGDFAVILLILAEKLIAAVFLGTWRYLGVPLGATWWSLGATWGHLVANGGSLGVTWWLLGVTTLIIFLFMVLHIRSKSFLTRL